MIKSTLILNTIIIPIFINLLIIIIIITPSKNITPPPIIIILILIIIIFIISIKINFINYNWISFILFLTIIGGLIIIYIYITSIANNELFFINLKLLLINLIKISPFWLIYIFLNLKNNEINIFILNNLEYYSIQKINFNLSIFNNLYKENNNNITYFIIIYLYYTIIIIINICYKYKAPLRQIIF